MHTINYIVFSSLFLDINGPWKVSAQSYMQFPRES